MTAIPARSAPARNRPRKGSAERAACTCETLKVRISDHGSCYCSEDISLVIPSGIPSGDDHSLDTLESLLRRKVIAE